MKKLYFLLFTFLIATASFGQIVINEIDADTPGTDVAEFIELKGTPSSSLNGYVVVLFNGSSDTSYAAFDLDGYSFDANGFFILANTPLVIAGDYDIGASNILQNGADAVALYQASDTDFPASSPVTTTNLIDVIVYGTADADDTGLLTSFGETTQWDESANGANSTESLQLNAAGNAYETKAPTFRAENDAAVCDLSLTTTSATCDAFTSGIDTYTATVDFSGGGTSTYTVTASSGTVDLSGGDPSLDATGTITVTGVLEGTDVTVTVQDGALCDLSSMITSPSCVPSLDLPIYESFNYTVGSNLIDDPKWENVSSSTDEVLVAGPGSLSYTGLATPEGNHVSFDGIGSDPAISFTPVISGEVYVSFIISVTDISQMTDLTDGGYFAVLGDNFDLRLWVRPNPDAAGSTFDFGFGDASSSPPVSSSTYSTNTNIFIVMSYDISSGNYNLWINPSDVDFEGSAPAATMTGTDATAATSIGQFLLRQDSTGETPFILFDELRIGTTWADVTPTTLSNNEFNLNNVSIYPNPTSTGFVTINSNNAEVINAKVFDILGKQVLDSNVNNNQLNVSNLNAGVYILKLTQNNATTTKKLVIK